MQAFTNDTKTNVSERGTDQSNGNAEMNNSSFLVTLTLHGLKSYSYYFVVVSPYNVAGKGVDSSLNFKTQVLRSFFLTVFDFFHNIFSY